jgi:hypothetical protein
MYTKCLNVYTAILLNYLGSGFMRYDWSKFMTQNLHKFLILKHIVIVTYSSDYKWGLDW